MHKQCLVSLELGMFSPSYGEILSVSKKFPQKRRSSTHTFPNKVQKCSFMTLDSSLLPGLDFCSSREKADPGHRFHIKHKVGDC